MVNTFIIVPDIYQTAKMLDDKRLGKQRLEAKQLIDVLERYDQTMVLEGGWSTHPATRSWVGYTNALKAYFNIMVEEWISRGNNNTMSMYPVDHRLFRIVPCSFDGKTAKFEGNFDQYCYPYWISFPPLYMSHQASLCRKFPEYYKNFLRDELLPFLSNGYLWPSNVSIDCYTNWNFSHHEDLSCGCPPEYKLKITEILRWSMSPNTNPKTGRKIKENSDIYQEYSNAMHRLEIKFENGAVFFRGVCCGPTSSMEAIIEYFKYLHLQGYFSVPKLVYYFAKVDYPNRIN